MFKSITRIIISLSICTIIIGTVNAYTFQQTNKEKLVYEITDLHLEEDGLHISGWAFINESQHYISPEDMYGEFVLINKAQETSYPIKFKYKNMTDLMRLDNVRRCKDTEYRKSGGECYYEYRYVGFDEVIPFDNLETGKKYDMKISLYAKNAQIGYWTYIMVTETDTVIDLDRKRIYLTSNLLDNMFYVNHAHVYARTSPGKNAPILRYTESKSEHGNYMYFDPFKTFKNIFEKRIIDDVSWYRVRSKYTGLFNGQYMIDEGNETDVWIASTFVEYNGFFTSLNVVKIQKGPQLFIEDQTIYIDDTSFNPDEHVWAYDMEDGELTPIRVSSNLNIHKKGNYIVRYKVTNSHNETAGGSMKVKVIDRPIENTAPIITVSERIVYQYAKINFMENVSATDLEDGDLTNKVVVTQEIDTHKLGAQEACYYVEDSEGLSNKTCSTIIVVEKPREEVNIRLGTLRFIHIDNPFIYEDVPNSWSIRDIRNALSGRHTLLDAYY